MVEFPEGPRVLEATDYEHLRPYLHAKRLRFSYGSDKGDAREAWQARAAALEAEPLADALERIGFAGLLVNRKAYADGARELRGAARGERSRARPGRAPTTTSSSSGCGRRRALRRRTR